MHKKHKRLKVHNILRQVRWTEYMGGMACIGGIAHVGHTGSTEVHNAQKRCKIECIGSIKIYKQDA